MPTDSQNSSCRTSTADRALARAPFALCLILWLLAMLSRETAVVLPVMLLALDLAFGERGHLRRRIPAYAAMGVIGGIFLLWRLSLAYHPMPDFYIRRYDGPAWFCWYAAKLMHWITSAIWLSPMTIGPTARRNPFTEVPGDCLLMLVIIAVMSGGYFLACRRARGWWVWPLWVLLTFLPVAPVMAGPQSGYPAGVGFSLAMVIGPALRHYLHPAGIGRWSKPVAIWFLIATCTYVPIYRKMWHSMNATERATMAGLAACPPGPSARELFFINLPFVNIYAQLHVREVLAPRQASLPWASPPELGAHVLTYAPNLLKMEYPTELEQLDTHSFRLRVTGGRPYFSGALGRYLIESMRPSGRFHPGETIRDRMFDVQIQEADADGARELIFRFHRPLASPEYSFYLTTNQCGAMRVRFWGPDEPPPSALIPAAGPRPTPGEVQAAIQALRRGEASAADILFTAAASDSTNPDVDRDAEAQRALREVVGPVAAAMAAPVQGMLFEPELTVTDWARVRTWWDRHVDNQVLQAFFRHQPEFEAGRWRRESLFRIREIAARIIRTDLYMTGPPFPSPR